MPYTTRESSLGLLREDFFAYKMEEIISKIGNIQDLYELSRIKNTIEGELVSFFAERHFFDGQSTDFIKAFEQGNESILLHKDTSVVEHLRRLMYEKNIFYRQMILSLTRQGKMQCLSEDETRSLECILDSGILQIFDDMYLGRRKHIPLSKKGYSERKQDDLIYGGIKGENFVSYGDFCDISKIETIIEKLQHIPQKTIREGLVTMCEYIQSKNYNYSDWVKLQGDTELKVWKEKESVFSYVGPMESYIFGEILVEPELCFFVKKYYHEANERNALTAIREFGDDYGMPGVNYYMCTEIVGAGVSGFKKHAGKNFPNDIPLAKQEGKFIYLMPTSFETIFRNGYPLVKKLFGEGVVLEESKLYPEFEQHVENHEFGHNLFYRNDSDLEESKPSLFHCLKLLEQLENGELDEDRIKGSIDFFVLDFMRDMERGYNDYKNNPIYRYTLYSRLVLREMLSTGVLVWNSQKTQMTILYEREKLKSFLIQMRKVLLEIQKIYAVPEKVGEKELIYSIEQTTEEDFQTIAKILGISL